MNELSFFSQSFQSIIARRNLEGIVSAGMIKQFLPIEVEFRNYVEEESNKVIIEIDALPFESLRNNLIIDHKICEEYNSVLGNIVICDNQFLNSPHLISEFFDINIDDLLLNVIFSIETSLVIDEEIENLAKSYLLKHKQFSAESLLDLAQNGLWEGIINLIKEEGKERYKESIQEKIKIEELNEKTLVILHSYQDIDSYMAARLVSKNFQAEGYNIILAEAYEERVFQGFLIGMRKSTITKIFGKSKLLRVKFEKVYDDVFFFRIYNSLEFSKFTELLKAHF